MKPQKQLFRHKPEDGVFGDCHRTAIAIVLDMEACDVPHFMGEGDTPDEANRACEAWLNARGISTINMMFDGDTELDDILSTIAGINRHSRPTYLLLGTSRNGCNHSVVCCDGKIVCDPSQDDSGIVGPCHDGRYWLTFFGTLQATDNPARHGLPKWGAPGFEREKLEVAAAILKTTLQDCGAKLDAFQVAIGTGELHAYANCAEKQWIFQRPNRAGGVPVEWHWREVAAA